MALTAAKKEFWGNLQADLYVANTAIYLANQKLSDIISNTGYKAHKPIMNHPVVNTYTPYSDISLEQKAATDQSLTVSTYKYAANEIDDTDQGQSPYDLTGHSTKSIREGLMTAVEQVYTSEFSNAAQSISGTPVVSASNIMSILEESEGKLGAYDAPFESAMRAIVFGPRTVASLRRAKGERETGLGDQVLQNGVVGEWNGWTVVQNNNLPWTANLGLATNPTDGDTLTIAGVTFEWQDDLDDVTSGSVGVLRHGSTVSTSRSNLVACLANTGTEGTNYTAMTPVQAFIIRRKRKVTATNAATMVFSGYGDIAVSESLTDTTDTWGTQQQTSAFMVRGAVDLVIQFKELEVIRKELGFADIAKGMIGVGAQTFDDGSRLMVSMTQDTSNW